MGGGLDADSGIQQVNGESESKASYQEGTGFFREMLVLDLLGASFIGVLHLSWDLALKRGSSTLALLTSGDTASAGISSA